MSLVVFPPVRARNAVRTVVVDPAATVLAKMYVYTMMTVVRNANLRKIPRHAQVHAALLLVVVGAMKLVS